MRRRLTRRAVVVTALVAVTGAATPAQALYEAAAPLDLPTFAFVAAEGGTACTLSVRAVSNPGFAVGSRNAFESARTRVTRSGCSAGRVTVSVLITDTAPGSKYFASGTASATTGPVFTSAAVTVPYSTNRPVGVMRVVYNVTGYGVRGCIEDSYALQTGGTFQYLGQTPCTGL